MFALFYVFGLAQANEQCLCASQYARIHDARNQQHHKSTHAQANDSEHGALPTDRPPV